MTRTGGVVLADVMPIMIDLFRPRNSRPRLPHSTSPPWLRPTNDSLTVPLTPVSRPLNGLNSRACPSLPTTPGPPDNPPVRPRVRSRATPPGPGTLRPVPRSRPVPTHLDGNPLPVPTPAERTCQPQSLPSRPCPAVRSPEPLVRL